MTQIAAELAGGRWLGVKLGKRKVFTPTYLSCQLKSSLQPPTLTIERALQPKIQDSWRGLEDKAQRGEQ